MTTPIRDEYFRQRSDLAEADKVPRTVIFSHEGWSKALKEESQNTVNITHGPSATYCGLHRCIDPSQKADIVVTHLTQAEYFAPRPRQNAVTVQLSFDAAKGQCLADGEPVGDPITTAQIIGSALTAAQLCDIIRAWLDSDDATYWGKFERALDDVLERYGTFE